MKLPFNIDLKDINEMKASAEKMQMELDQVEATGTAGADMVTVRINGKGDVLEVSISDEAYSIGGKQALQTLVAAAIAAALRNLKEARDEKQAEIVGRMMPSFYGKN